MKARRASADAHVPFAIGDLRAPEPSHGIRVPRSSASRRRAIASEPSTSRHTLGQSRALGIDSRSFRAPRAVSTAPDSNTGRRSRCGDAPARVRRRGGTRSASRSARDRAARAAWPSRRRVSPPNHRASALNWPLGPAGLEPGDSRRHERACHEHTHGGGSRAGVPPWPRYAATYGRPRCAASRKYCSRGADGATFTLSPDRPSRSTVRRRDIVSGRTAESAPGVDSPRPRPRTAVPSGIALGLGRCVAERRLAQCRRRQRGEGLFDLEEV